MCFQQPYTFFPGVRILDREDYIIHTSYPPPPPPPFLPGFQLFTRAVLLPIGREQHPPCLGYATTSMIIPMTSFNRGTYREIFTHLIREQLFDLLFVQVSSKCPNISIHKTTDDRVSIMCRYTTASSTTCLAA